MAIRPHLVSGSQAQGVLHVHSSPVALCPHIEWAAQACGADSIFSWLPQSAMPGTKRAEVAWRGQLGTGVALASRLARFGQIRFEITEAADGSQGMRYAYTPSLGSFSAAIGPHGDVMLSENQLRHAMTQTDPSTLSSTIDQLLGGPWDAELEVFRYAETDGSVRWLHRVS
ncbi:MAG: hypothetical protein CSA64_03790 [Arachnia propionica]|nr:MAG: hypothetical protein CSA64_03790 [Arachnia propionica]